MFKKIVGVGVVGLAVLVAFLGFDRSRIQEKYDKSQANLATAGQRISDLLDAQEKIINQQKKTDKITHDLGVKGESIIKKTHEAQEGILDAKSSAKVNIDSPLPKSLLDPLILRWERSQPHNQD